MPAVKPPPKPKTENASNATLDLFRQNLTDMRLWYRDRKTDGPDVGAFIIMEQVLEYVAEALALAIEGKRWVSRWPKN